MLSRDDIMAALSQSSPVARGLRGDHDLNPDWKASLSTGERALRKAAVLIPIVAHSQGLTILFTERTAHLNTHAGQVSFPGGSVDEGDRDAVSTALRETQEEIGLRAHQMEVIGRLDTYETGSNFSITPVVAMVAPGFTLRLDPHEVESTFEVPLAHLMAPENHERRSGIYKNVKRYYYSISFEDRMIWGATAAIFLNLYDVLSHYHEAENQGEIL